MTRLHPRRRSENFALRIVRDRRAHAAAGRGQRHFHFHLRAAFRFVDQLAIVNQAEIDDVYRDFRIVTLLELVPDGFLIDRPSLSLSALCRAVRLRFFQTERVQIFFGDARQTLICRDRVAAAECLRDYALRAGRNRILFPLGI